MTDRRLIEVSLPLLEISDRSAHEKHVQHGHISTLQIWWARRPLAACRAAVFATLIDAPEDDAERKELENLIATIVDWDQVKDGNSGQVQKARALIQKQFQGNGKPRVLDPFAGGGAIPLEALRLGCRTHALELNPVAYLAELCTIVYPQRYSQRIPQPRPRVQEAHLSSAHSDGRQLNMEGIGQGSHWALAQDVERWGKWVYKEARREIGDLYENPTGPDTIVGYFWARTILCPNPSCGAKMPLVRQYWLRRDDSKQGVALRPRVNLEEGEVNFDIVRGDEITFNPSEGTVGRGSATCLVCGQTAGADYLKAEATAGRMGEMPLGVVTTGGFGEGKEYHPFTRDHLELFKAAEKRLAELEREHQGGLSLVPDEPTATNTQYMGCYLYGLDTWGELFNARQLLALTTFVTKVQAAYGAIAAEENAEYARAIATYLGIGVSRLADRDSSLCIWDTRYEKAVNTFLRQALPIVWDYTEVNPFGGSFGDWFARMELFGKVITSCSRASDTPAEVQQGTATRLPYPDAYFDAVITDPPYYGAVPYADLSDFFYVWLRRAVGNLYPTVFRSPLTPKSAEIVQNPARHEDARSAKEFYERQMTKAFKEAFRVLKPAGRCAIMFAHKSTAAWETLIASLLGASLITTASWPLRTERSTRLRAQGSAALASSILLVCKKRPPQASVGYYDQVRSNLEARIHERLDFFWSQGIRGSDFFISAIGPALEVFGQHEEVRRLSGEKVTVSEFLNEVHSIVTDYALAQVLHDGHVGAVDPATRFYVIWRWAYGNNKVPFDDGRVLAQALGAEIDDLMHKTNLLRGRKNLRLWKIKARVNRNEDLGEPKGGVPAPLIDVLQRACVLWEREERVALSEFLNRALMGRDKTFWSVGQSLSEILPDGSKEKQLLQGLLVSQDRLPDVPRQDTLL